MSEFWTAVQRRFSSAGRGRHFAPVEVVPHVDLERYLGDWFEIATIPQSFQRDCTATRTTYALRDDGEIDVVNRCRLGTPDGPEKKIHGQARVVDTATNAKLKVSFFRPFWSDYWVIDLGQNYEYAVVAGPTREYLWILSRTPQLSDEVYAGILQRLQAQGFDTGKLQTTRQR